MASQGSSQISAEQLETLSRVSALARAEPCVAAFSREVGTVQSSFAFVSPEPSFSEAGATPGTDDAPGSQSQARQSHYRSPVTFAGYLMNKRQYEEEQAILEAFVSQFSDQYAFTTDETLAGPCRELLTFLLAARLSSKKFRLQWPRAHVLAVVQCLRVLMRDSALQKVLVELGGVEIIALEVARLTHIHLGMSEEPDPLGRRTTPGRVSRFGELPPSKRMTRHKSSNSLAEGSARRRTSERTPPAVLLRRRFRSVAHGFATLEGADGEGAKAEHNSRSAVEDTVGALESFAEDQSSSSDEEETADIMEDLFVAEMLAEYGSMLRRLAAATEWRETLALAGVPTLLTQLLRSRDATLLPLVLVALRHLAADKSVLETIAATTDAPEVLMEMLRSYPSPLRDLALGLILPLARHSVFRGDLLELDAVPVVLGLLGANPGGELCVLLLKTMCALIVGPQGVQEARTYGAIPVLLACLAKDSGAPPPGARLRSAWVTARCSTVSLTCTAITRLIEDIDGAYQVRQNNGIYVLGWQLIDPLGVRVEAKAGAAPASVLGDGPAKNPPRDARKALEDMTVAALERYETLPPALSSRVDTVRAWVMRALRFMFSVERHRKVFKRLLPAGLFGSFIDIGNYEPDPRKYQPAVQAFNSLGARGAVALACGLEDHKAAEEGEREVVQRYEIVELLGRGAYGAVYKARKQGEEGEMVALKEISMENTQLFGQTQREKDLGVGQMCREIEILAGLDHPNIVKYHESFVARNRLWIVMELSEGASLLDYITDVREKGQRIPEDHVWQCLVAVVTALDYVHNARGVVHRDLTPGNIMLGLHGEGGSAASFRRAKVTDFGLARELTQTMSVAASMCGTVPYMCPEMIQNERYSAKADMWSLGCVVYHMMMLRPPFEGNNPLAIASRIVEGRFDPPQEPPGTPRQLYSDELRALCLALLTPDPSRRPGARDVVAMAAGRVLEAMTACREAEEVWERRWGLERAKRMRAQEHYRRVQNVVDITAAAPAPAPAERDLLGGATDGNDSSNAVTPTQHGVTHFPTGSDGAGNSANGNAVGGEGEAAAMGPETPRLLPTRGASGSGALAPPTRKGRVRVGSRTITITSDRLRPIDDPVVQMLHVLHKVLYIDQLPPGPSRDWKRRCVERFRKHLFHPMQHGASIKTQLSKLVSGSQDLIDLTFRVEQGENGTSGLSNGDGGAQGRTGTAGRGKRQERRLTYDALMGIIHDVLQDTGFHAARRQGLGRAHAANASVRGNLDANLPIRAAQNSTILDHV
ncbi:unnamed protein product [Pedinophyceae sp. YPF-701]|nr:unnamed protein product [Pedinophyceae sp. YPF-701]